MELDFFAPTGAMIQEYLDLNGMTKEELAQKLGITNGYMDRLLDSSMPMSEEVAIDISNAFGIETHYFIEYEKSYREFLKKKTN